MESVSYLEQMVTFLRPNQWWHFALRNSWKYKAYYISYVFGFAACFVCYFLNLINANILGGQLGVLLIFWAAMSHQLFSEIRISPKTLCFNGPRGTQITREAHLENPNREPIYNLIIHLAIPHQEFTDIEVSLPSKYTVDANHFDGARSNQLMIFNNIDNDGTKVISIYKRKIEGRYTLPLFFSAPSGAEIKLRVQSYSDTDPGLISLPNGGSQTTDVKAEVLTGMKSGKITGWKIILMNE